MVKGKYFYYKKRYICEDKICFKCKKIISYNLSIFKLRGILKGKIAIKLFKSYLSFKRKLY